MQEATRLFELEDMFEAFADEYLAEFWPHDSQTYSVVKKLDFHILGIRAQDSSDRSEFATGPSFVDLHLLIHRICDKDASGQNEDQTTFDRSQG
jgi:hypothetical protein